MRYAAPAGRKASASSKTAATAIGAGAQSVALDVADAHAVASHIGNVAQEHGRIDAVFDSAGIGVGVDLRELNPDRFKRSIDANIRGVIHGCICLHEGAG